MKSSKTVLCHKMWYFKYVFLHKEFCRKTSAFLCKINNVKFGINLYWVEEHCSGIKKVNSETWLIQNLRDQKKVF
jgi:hypothetical protein